MNGSKAEGLQAPAFRSQDALGQAFDRGLHARALEDDVEPIGQAVPDVGPDDLAGAGLGIEPARAGEAEGEGSTGVEREVGMAGVDDGGEARAVVGDFGSCEGVLADTGVDEEVRDDEGTGVPAGERAPEVPVFERGEPLVVASDVEEGLAVDERGATGGAVEDGEEVAFEADGDPPVVEVAWASVEEGDEGGDGGRARVEPRGEEGTLEEVGFEEVVGVEGDDPSAARGGEARVTRGAEPAVGLADDAEGGVAGEVVDDTEALRIG